MNLYDFEEPVCGAVNVCAGVSLGICCGINLRGNTQH
jgi:hypothetical protein